MRPRSIGRVAPLTFICLALAVPPAPSMQENKETQTLELPEGEGKVILLRACTNCHDLGGLKLFKGYYTEELWRELVVDMVRVGAQVKEDEITILAKYLAEHFGPAKN